MLDHMEILFLISFLKNIYFYFIFILFYLFLFILKNIYLICARPQLQHVGFSMQYAGGSLVAASKLLVAAVGI